MSHKKCFWYRIDISEGIDINKVNKSKECMLCQFLDRNFSYGPYLCYNIMKRSVDFKKCIQNLFSVL